MTKETERSNRLYAVLGAILVILGLGACGNDNGNNTSQNTPEIREEVWVSMTSTEQTDFCATMPMVEAYGVEYFRAASLPGTSDEEVQLVYDISIDVAQEYCG